VTPELKGFILLGVIKMLIVFTVYNVGVMMVIWAERRVSAWMQYRLGPNRVGPEGLLQSVADGLKNIMKEETFPEQRDKLLFLVAPTMSFIPALLTFAVIPWAAPVPVNFDFALPFLGEFSYHGPMSMAVADLPVGFLFILAISSLGIYGIVLAGWASNSKYALLGGLRSSAQMVSYEISMGMSLIAVLILSGDVTLSQVVATQQQSLPFVLLLSGAFLLFIISAFAETNRLPFDLPETESELVTGYHTEYSSMKFSMFFIAEYANLITASALIATLFFGGWDIPFTHWDDTNPTIFKSIVTLGVMSAKTLFFVFTYIWVRWTLPRFRFDQLMQLGWKLMIPGALAYISLIATTVWALGAANVVFGSAMYNVTLMVVNAVVVGWLVFSFDRGRVLLGSRREHDVVEA
jgi:NADH-quinone oxidoreductase subunit H